MRRGLLRVVGPDDEEPRARRRVDRAFYERTIARLEANGWHPAVTAIEAALVVERVHAERERQAR